MSFWAGISPRSIPARRLVVALWAMVLISIPVSAHFHTYGWDLGVYRAAIRAERIGHNPYTDTIANQAKYHEEMALQAKTGAVTPTNVELPYNFVYSPMTLPLFRFIGRFPGWLSGVIYWMVYGLGAFSLQWAEIQLMEESERVYFMFFAPVAVFFPGLLADGIILCGNISFIVYGTALVTALRGWRSGRWLWFYIAVLAASCFKIPLLSLLAIPLLSARKQLIPVVLTAVSGVCLFAVQPILWPGLFRSYLQAIDLQFTTNQDFGASPAGIFSGLLFDHGFSYSRGGFIFYLGYAIPLCGVLVYLSRKYLNGSFPLTRWAPVLLVGVILLNPRVVEYDLAILTLPLALIVWRLFPELAENRAAAILGVTAFGVMNLVASQTWILWKNIACVLLVSVFSAGAWQLHGLAVGHRERSVAFRLPVGDSVGA